MKALSLKQPYAELIVQGRKKVELREWNTKFRGEFLIHASKSTDERAMKQFRFTKLSTGCIVGKAKLMDVKYYKNRGDFLKDKVLHLASEEFGSFGFILENAERVKEIPCKGALGFWDFDGKSSAP